MKKPIDREKVAGFMPLLDNIIEHYPAYQYPAYFKAKLLLALGDKENMLSSLLPFAKKKRNDFWVWEVLSEAVSNDKEKVLACYCKALICKTPEEFLVSIRQKLALLMIEKQLFNEAKTEIELLLKTRHEHGYKIPETVSSWTQSGWYKNAVAKRDNHDFYDHYSTTADAILYSDITEETVIVEFVNSEKKILNFIASKTKFGFFKYDRFLDKVSIGDVLNVRFNGNGKEGAFQVYTVAKIIDDAFKKQYIKEVEGRIRINEGKTFGFLNDAFIHPSIISKYKLQHNQLITAIAIQTFNKEKNQWSWKVFEVSKKD